LLLQGLFFYWRDYTAPQGAAFLEIDGDIGEAEIDRVVASAFRL
jgi:hypothetical protein